MHVEPPCEQGVASTDRTWATLSGHFKGRVIRDVSHLPPAGRPLAPPLGFRSPADPRSLAAHPLRGVTNVPLESVPVGGRPAGYPAAICCNDRGALATGVLMASRFVWPVRSRCGLELCRRRYGGWQSARPLSAQRCRRLWMKPTYRRQVPR